MEANWSPSLVVYNGRVCYMIQRGDKWVYIPEREYKEEMNDEH